MVKQYDHDVVLSLQNLLLQCVSLHTENFQILTWKLCVPMLTNDHKEVEAIIELSRAIDFKPDLQLLHLRAAFYDSMGDYVSTVTIVFLAEQLPIHIVLEQLLLLYVVCTIFFKSQFFHCLSILLDMVHI